MQNAGRKLIGELIANLSAEGLPGGFGRGEPFAPNRVRLAVGAAGEAGAVQPRTAQPGWRPSTSEGQVLLSPLARLLAG